MKSKKVPGRTLPDGTEVSLLGLGTVKFGRLTGLSYPTAKQLPSLSKLSRLLEHAQHLGINLLDTAPAYGLSEERLGQLLQGQRDRWVISSKVGEQLFADRSCFAFDKSSVRRSLETSLTRLGVDHLDMVWVHSDGNDLDILRHTDIVPTLLQAQEEGLVKLTGASVKTVAGALLSLELLDLVMCTYNLRVRDQLVALRQAGVTGSHRAVIKKPLDSGQLGAQLATALTFAASAPGVACLLLGSLDEEHLSQAVQCVAEPG